MALEGFDHGNDAIMAADAKVVALGNVVSQDDTRILADAGEDGQKNATL